MHFFWGMIVGNTHFPFSFGLHKTWIFNKAQVTDQEKSRKRVPLSLLLVYGTSGSHDTPLHPRLHNSLLRIVDGSTNFRKSKSRNKAVKIPTMSDLWLRSVGVLSDVPHEVSTAAVKLPLRRGVSKQEINGTSAKVPRRNSVRCSHHGGVFKWLVYGSFRSQRDSNGEQHVWNSA